MGGKSGGGSVTVGYRYSLGIQVAVCHGEVDEVSELIVGERTAWTGSVTKSGDVYIDKPGLFGGDDREGGVQGTMSLCFGEPGQMPNAYVQQQRGDKVSANRGLLTLVFGKGAPVGDLVAVDYSKLSISTTFKNKMDRTYRVGSDIDAILANPQMGNSKALARGVCGRFDPNFNTTEFDSLYKLSFNPAGQGNDASYPLKVYMYRVFTQGTQKSARSPLSEDYDENWRGPDVYRGVKYKAADIFNNTQAAVAVTRPPSQPFLWTSMNPYFKPIWLRVKNILKGWSIGAAWYPARAQIGTYDMNPAHIIYRVLTDTNWGMGYLPGDIDEPSFKAAADTLYAEKFGLSLKWAREAPIGEFVQTVLQHIDANLRIDIRTGRFVLQLIRSVDATTAATRVASESNIIAFNSYSRSTWGDGANEIVLTYKDRNEDDAVVTVQNLAAVEAQGGVITRTITFNGIHEFELAAKVAQRELNLVSTPLSTVNFTMNREFWDLNIGDVFALKWPSLGIESAVYRITGLDTGTLMDGTVTVDAVEDIFNLPSASYVQVQDSLWSNPATEPKPIAVQVAREASYWDVVNVIGERAIELLKGDEAFGKLVAEAPQGDAQNFKLNASGTNTLSTYVDLGTYSFAGAANLMQSVAHLDRVLKVDNMDVALLGSLKKPYAIVDDEEMMIVSYDVVNMTITVERGINDTTPRPHYMLSKVYMVDSVHPSLDVSDRVLGETVYYRGRTRTPRGLLALESAIPASVTFDGRMWKPYVPGNVKVDGAYYPATIGTGTTLSVSWSSRNRLTQTAQFSPFTTGNIASEPGVTYTVEVYNRAGDLIKKTEGYTSTSWSWSNELQEAPYTPTVPGKTWYDSRVPPIAPRLNEYLRIVVYSVRDGVRSHQQFEHEIRRPFTDTPNGENLYGTSGYGYNYGDD